MLSTCAIIVCDHGLGHVRRCALIAKEREKTGEQVTLFAPRISVERLQRAVPSMAGLTVKDFSTRTTPQRVRGGLTECLEWLDRLPDLDRFETLICDNLPEILEIRTDATICAQFFWHDVIEGASKDYVEYCDALLAQHRPKVLGCEMFSMDAVRRQPNYKPVGLYQIPELVAAKATQLSDPQDLLITGGSTSIVREQALALINEFLDSSTNPYCKIHVDRELVPQNAPDWIVPAEFNIAMYCSIKSAICRPGLGVITDLLTVGVCPRPIYEKGNREMEFNASILNAMQKNFRDSVNSR